MATKPYLLKLKEYIGDDEFITTHLIEAESAQMVKYHYHRTLKDWNYNNAWGRDKHRLERGRLGAEIYAITPLDPVEYDVLSDHFMHWTKV